MKKGSGMFEMIGINLFTCAAYRTSWFLKLTMILAGNLLTSLDDDVDNDQNSNICISNWSQVFILLHALKILYFKHFLCRNPIAVYPFYRYGKITILSTPAIKQDGAKVIQSIENFNSRETDVILCSSMKSGLEN